MTGEKENLENQRKRKLTLEDLIVTIAADSEMRTHIYAVMSMVSGGYKEWDDRVDPLWKTLGEMCEAISNGNVDAYNAARDRDPSGTLALNVGMIYADIKHEKQFEQFRKWELAYREAHPDRNQYTLEQSQRFWRMRT